MNSFFCRYNSRRLLDLLLLPYKHNQTVVKRKITKKCALLFEIHNIFVDIYSYVKCFIILIEKSCVIVDGKNLKTLNRDLYSS